MSYARIAKLLSEHQQESTSACGPEDYCECGYKLIGRPIWEHQARVLTEAT